MKEKNETKKDKKKKISIHIQANITLQDEKGSIKKYRFGDIITNPDITLIKNAKKNNFAKIIEE